MEELNSRAEMEMRRADAERIAKIKAERELNAGSIGSGRDDSHVTETIMGSFEYDAFVIPKDLEAFNQILSKIAESEGGFRRKIVTLEKLIQTIKDRNVQLN